MVEGRLSRVWMVLEVLLVVESSEGCYGLDLSTDSSHG